MKILVFGATGWIGSRMMEAWPDAVAADRSARLENKSAVLAEIEKHKPDAVVNAAGAIGKPNVDWCETHQLETIRGNTINPLILAEACQEKNVYLLQLGTGCMYYGLSPDPRGWKETDHANPSAVYTRSKYAADLAMTTMPNIAIARLRMPIEEFPSSRNLIDKLVSYSDIIDVANSVTVIPDLIDACRKIIERRGTGVFHVVNPGVMRHSDLIRLYQEFVNPDHHPNWVDENELLRLGKIKKKRSTCILQSERLRELGIEMRPIDVALRDTMMKYAQHIHASPVMRHDAQQANPASFSFLKSVDSLSTAAAKHTRPKQMKGVILAGGRGTRLAPLTNITNKHLLPVADRQMILYPLQTLLDAGIRQIMIITGPDHAGHFMNLLGSGKDYGCSLTYRIQDEAGGISHALGLAEDFVDGDNCTVILGDNLFDENFFPHISSFQGGAMAFYKPVDDPRRFGVMELDAFGNVLSIEEKPEQPKSNFAQVGLYVYDAQAFDFIKQLTPSSRGELEVTDLNNAYLRQGKLTARPVRGFWSDAGTHQSLQRATEYFAKKDGTNS